MGIQGLLPALKSVQNTKHLSEFSGQTIAVDGYVWLHKGVFTCATELATGKSTQKYVNYAMEKVRLLRYHGIEPYIVFDGGPLPAKRGTEDERKRRRDEQLARGNLLSSQGKHSEARECYLKCVDVTPQMAYQLIKALRAESVQYVVAPYEADAQLAFLERQGVVSAVLTEDSDLLVFGCKVVLLKLDSVTRTVVSISRKDFASVTANSSDSNGISLVGWSDTQFRAMAILSGCDYLPSIPGIGLKTACTMLRKWKTPQAVVRQVGLEGKKRVPKGYLDQFRLAENCFLHQRVYDPLTEKLVYLTDVGNDWDDSAEAYVGGDMDPILAKKLALGDVDPITLEPMVDIYPGFCPRPRVLRDLPNATNFSKGRGKEKSRPSTGGILSFFGPNPIIPPPPKAPKPTAGKASGKRTLAEVLEQDLSVKKKKKNPSSAPTSPKITSSKFFVTPMASNARRASSGAELTSSAIVQPETEKENVFCDDEGLADDGDSMEVRMNASSKMEDLQSEDGLVEQEDGYLSPTPSMSRDVDDLSSPARPSSSQTRRNPSQDEQLDVDPISSPPYRADPPWQLQRSQSIPTNPPSLTPKVLVRASPEIVFRTGSEPVAQVNLKDCFGDEHMSEIEDDLTSRTPSPSPLTPDDLVRLDQDRAEVAGPDDDLEPEDPEERELIASATRNQQVSQGWRNRWALRRSETNITPTGRHRLLPLSQSGSISRKSLVFEEVRRGDNAEGTFESLGESITHAEGMFQSQLRRFRYQ